MKRILLSLLVLCSVFPAFGQESKPPALTSAVPPSPAAAALGKFADIPVGLYTGTPQISIPLWEVKDNGLSLPISLSYHAGGIKVEEIPSWVGLGWALNAGGVITRTVRGLPDEGPNGIFSKMSPVEQVTYNPDTDYEKFKEYADGVFDAEPDLFFFNFAGKTGKFIMDPDKNVHIIPHQRIRLVPTFTNGEIRGWTVTAEDGTRYLFKEKDLERSRVASLCGFLAAWPSPAVSSWYLSEIQAPGGARVSFEYTLYDYYDLPMSVSETNYIKDAGAGSKPNVKCETRMDLVEGKRLRRIRFSGGEIEFIEGGKRADLVHEPMLEEVLVRNQRGDTLRRIELGHGYLAGTNIVDISNYTVDSTSMSSPTIRLMLTKVTETGYDSAKPVQKPPHQFTYRTSDANSKGLPSRLGYGYQDHWGFFNGKYSNTLVPEQVHYSPAVSGEILLEGANRHVDSASTKVGTLTKIVYPTGGYTAFEYEQNDCQSKMLHKKVKDDSKGLSSAHADSVVKTDPFDIVNISSSGAYVKITYSDNYDPASDGTFRILKNGNPDSAVYTSLGQTTLSHTIFIKNGTYVIELTKEYTPDPYAPGVKQYTMRLDWFNQLEDPNKWVGGLRVRKVTDYDPVAQRSTSRWYEYKFDSGLSSGSVIGVPEYGYRYEETSSTGEQGIFFVRTSNSNTPLGTTQGSNVGYEQVTVLYGEGGANGKSVSVYTSPRQFPDIYNMEGSTTVATNSNQARLRFPFSPTDGRDWLRGLSLRVTEYRRQDGQFYPVSRTENTYNFYHDHTAVNQPAVLGVKVGYDIRYELEGRGNSTLAVAFFKIRSGYQNLASTKVTTFDQDTTRQANRLTTYTYSHDHLQMLTSTDWTSESNKLITTSLAYPPDYADQSGFIKDMVDANILMPVEKVIYEEDASKANQRILSGQVSTYKPGNRGLMDELWMLESPSPVPLSSFKFSNAAKGLLPDSTKTAFEMDPLYKKRVVYSKYDDRGNIRENAMEDGIPVSYLWGYQQTLPIAEVKNASLMEEAEVTNKTLPHTLTLMQDVETLVAFSEKLTLDRLQKISIAYAPEPFGGATMNTFKLTVKDAAGNAWLSFMPFYGSPDSVSLELPAGTYTYYYTADITPSSTTDSGVRVELTTRYTSTAMRSNILHTSFEEDTESLASGNSVTGRKSHSGSFTFPLPTQAGSYTLTYWARPLAGGEWGYVSEQVEVTSTSASSKTIGDGSSALDEVRFYPANAQMSTYTYDPLVGMTSACDINNRIIYYEYDALGRLQAVKDEEGNVLKSHQYHYAGQKP